MYPPFNNDRKNQFVYHYNIKMIGICQITIIKYYSLELQRIVDVFYFIPHRGLMFFNIQDYNFNYA